MSFITIEGGEGTGKSTLITALVAALQGQNEERDVVQTREPGGSAGAEEIRALLVTGEAARWDAMTELLLVNAARRDHVERVIRPALERGATVVCDRYIDSTRAYQGLRGAQSATLERLHTETIGLDPDQTLILDVPPSVGLARAATRGGDARFESMGMDYHTALREKFLSIAAADPERCHVIDSTQSPEAVLHDALQVLSHG